MNDERFFSALSRVADVFVAPIALSRGVSLDFLRQTVEYRALADLTSVLNRNQTNNRIGEIIEGSHPALVTRFGSTEMRVVLKHHGRGTRSALEKGYALFSRLEWPLWAKWEHISIRKKSGFYPVTEPAIDCFVDEMKRAMAQIDLLGSWVPGENKLAGYFPRAAITDLPSLSPLGVEKPWTHSLSGKKVLVVHPFKDSIEKQYSKRRELFSDPDFMPDFDLTVIKAVQSLGTPPAEFPTWFHGLDFMHDQTRTVDFDVALIACGAYGFPLGARIKGDGRQAIVLGGILQLLFGIKGRRWDGDGLYNDRWIRPSEAERPDGFRGADGGAYW